MSGSEPNSRKEQCSINDVKLVFGSVNLTLQLSSVQEGDDQLETIADDTTLQSLHRIPGEKVFVCYGWEVALPVASSDGGKLVCHALEFGQKAAVFEDPILELSSERGRLLVDGVHFGQGRKLGG